MERRLVLCADDFGFSPAVSRVIADLAGAGRINATGCMATMPGWPSDAAMLRDLPARVRTGVHLTLTLEAPLTRMPRLAPAGMLPGIDELRRHASALPLSEIAAEVSAQLDRFAQVMGRAPDFVDAHQHAHVLPGIRDVVLDAVAAQAPGAWVRDCVDRASAIAARPWRGKAAASAWRSRGLARAAATRGLTVNRGFAGHYGFAGDYRAIFPRFLTAPGDVHLVMCHPGAGERSGDAIAAARADEAAALATLPVAELAAARGLTF